MRDRLQKLLSRSGIGSRRGCEKLILDGRVKVNGEIVSSLPVMVDPLHDRVEIDGKLIHISPQKKIYMLMNKPKGVVCTVRDERGRKGVLDILPPGAIKERVFPVGRLDKDSQGLLLLTNDGELTKKLTHGGFGIQKVYIVEVEGHADGAVVEKMLKGIWLEEGKAKAQRVKIIKRGHERSILEVTLTEGKNRQIRRMLAKLNLPVKKLTRIKLGTLELKGVGVGRIRRIMPFELDKLKKLVNQKFSCVQVKGLI